MVLKNDKKMLLKDIQVFKDDDEHVLIGCESMNQYIRLHTSHEKSVEDLLLQYDGNHERREIQRYCLDNRININLDVLEQQLQMGGMFENSNHSKAAKNEIECLGIKIFLCTVKDYKNKLIQNFCMAISSILYLLIVVSVVYLLFHMHLVSSFFNRELLNYQHSYALGVIVTVVCSYLTLFMHEMAHVVVGYAQGLSLHKIGFYMYMGFIPQWFVSFRGIWRAERKSKIQVYCAGIGLNLLIALQCCIFSGFSQCTDLLKSIAVGSLFMGINSLFPFNLTDGYFLFSTLLHRDNLRHDMIMEMRNILHFQLKREKKTLYLYTLVNVLFYMAKLFFCYYWLFQSLLELTQYAMVLIGVCVIVHVKVLYKKGLDIAKMQSDNSF